MNDLRSNAIKSFQATGEDYSVEPAETRRPFRALLDVGLIKTTTGNRVFGALKVLFWLDRLLTIVCIGICARDGNIYFNFLNNDDI